MYSSSGFSRPSTGCTLSRAPVGVDAHEGARLLPPQRGSRMRDVVCLWPVTLTAKSCSHVPVSLGELGLDLLRG